MKVDNIVFELEKGKRLFLLSSTGSKTEIRRRGPWLWETFYYYDKEKGQYEKGHSKVILPQHIRKHLSYKWDKIELI